MEIKSKYDIGTSVRITSGRFSGFVGTVEGHFNSLNSETGKYEAGVTVIDTNGERRDAFDSRIEVNKEYPSQIKGWEIIDQFIEEMKQEDMEYFARLKQLKKDIGYDEWVKKIVDGEITKTDSALIRKSDEYIKDQVEKDAANRKKKMQKQISDKIGNIVECDLHRNSNGGFDGKIKGDKGQIYIETIVAGGYNIQRAHYRTLIK